jgi:hypothetical protein
MKTMNEPLLIFGSMAGMFFIPVFGLLIGSILLTFVFMTVNFEKSFVMGGILGTILSISIGVFM